MRGDRKSDQRGCAHRQEGGTVFHVVPLAETEVDDEVAPATGETRGMMPPRPLLERGEGSSVVRAVSLRR